MTASNLVPAFVGFAIVVFLLWRYAVPPVRKLMRKEQDAVRRQMAEADAARERLEEAEAKYRDAVANARTEAARIRDTARADAQRIVEEMRERAEQEAERIRASGAEQLASQRQQIVRELHAEVGELATELAGRLVSEHMDDSANRAASVDRFIDELEGMSAQESSAQESSAQSSVSSKGGS